MKKFNEEDSSTLEMLSYYSYRRNNLVSGKSSYCQLAICYSNFYYSTEFEKVLYCTLLLSKDTATTRCKVD